MTDWRENPLFRRAASFAQASQDEIARVSAEIAPKAASLVKHVPFVEDAVAAYYAAMDPDVPSTTRAMIWGPLLYFVLPLDAIPDIIPGAGFVDDAAVIALLLNTVRSSISRGHRSRARSVLGLPPLAPEAGTAAPTGPKQ